LFSSKWLRLIPAILHARLMFWSSSASAGIETWIGTASAGQLGKPFVSDGADPRDAMALLETFQSGHVFGALLPGVFRGPALVFALGALLILLEIFTAQALLSQIGNIMSLGAGVRFAWLLSHGNQAGALSQSGRVGAGAVH